MDDATFEVTNEAEGRVRLHIDRPGIAAVSYEDDPRVIIDYIAEVAALGPVSYEEDARPE